MNPKIEYIDSKLDYKNDLITDLYVLSLQRRKTTDRETALEMALEEWLGDDKEALLQDQTL